MSVTLQTQGNLSYLTDDAISVPHCFTTRLGGISQGYLASMNLGFHRGDTPEAVEENYAILGQALGFSPEDLVLTRQTHSDIVRTVGRADCGLGLDHHLYPECDALITNTPGVGLVVFTADCTPILLHDPVTGAVGAIHAGWRGTAMGIAQKTVAAMVRDFGCAPGNIRAAIGPNIAQCCFETDRDVPDAITAALKEGAAPFLKASGGKYYPDLKGINALWLQKAGVTHISVSPLCTACRTDLFWSHRKMGPRRGSQGAIILCKEVQP